MKHFTPKELCEIVNGKIVVWNNNLSVTSFREQPEDPKENCLHFLFDTFEDEDKFIEELKGYKIAGIIASNKDIDNLFEISKWEKAKIGVISVNHLNDAYIDLARKYRLNFDIPFVEVTGSSGKTTTKEIVGAILNEKVPTLVGFNNYNAPSGVAYNLFNLRDYHKAAVLEVGMKAAGIIEYSSGILKPNIGVITSIHRSHFVSLGSIDNIIAAKAELLDAIDENGILIINGDDENCQKLPLGRCKGEVLTFGFSNKFDIWASDIKFKNFKTYFTVNTKKFKFSCTLNTFGKYNVANALAAILVGLKLGLSPKEIISGLLNFQPLKGRLTISNGINNTTLINDNFNANPDSTRLLLQEIPNIRNNRPVILVIGDMERPDEEIREYAEKVHFSIGILISTLNIDYTIAIGKWAKEYVNGAIKGGLPNKKISHFDNVEEAKDHIKDFIIDNSIIIFKASLYVPVRHLIDALNA